MERYEIETFLTLAEELHFARTAERLNISPGRVSQVIKKLERRIGSPLFERTSRNVALTALGRRFHEELRPGYQQVQQAIRNVTSAGRGIGGTVGVGFCAPWAGQLLVRAADAFHAEYPNCQLRIREVSLADPFGPLAAGELDLQFSEWPIDDPEICAGPILFSEPAALMVPAGHPLAGRSSASLEDLARGPLITFAGLSRGFHEIHYPHRTPAGEHIEHLPVTMHFHETVEFIAAGKGITVVSARLQRYLRRDDIVYLPLADAPPLEYGLAWRNTRETPTIRALVHTICQLARRDPHF